MKTRNEIYKGINNKIDHQYAVLEVLLDIRDSLTEKKLPHAHCKCMNLDGQCPNYHYATCSICKPEKKLPVECECELCEQISKFGGAFECTKGEPEKTVESEWEREIRFLATDAGQGDKDKIIEIVRNLLTSHTEQKKEELEKSIKSLQTYSGIDGEPIDDGRMLSKNDVVHLIKEL